MVLQYIVVLSMVYVYSMDVTVYKQIIETRDRVIECYVEYVSNCNDNVLSYIIKCGTGKWEFMVLGGAFKFWPKIHASPPYIIWSKMGCVYGRWGSIGVGVIYTDVGFDLITMYINFMMVIGTG
ncbi:hypothetical protein TcCL_ESM12882 [Trypanosoma cruzi]|nr:hypothetical protein TcCL_ESM12882 [Trypanosoma cruzi]